MAREWRKVTKRTRARKTYKYRKIRQRKEYEHRKN